MRRLALLVLAASAGVAGCVHPDPTPRFTPAWETVDTSAPGWHSTRKALICADCQFNNLYSKPLPERNLSAEAMAATAIRPPQLDLFSSEVLKWILATDGPDCDVVLHLGDAANTATTGELDKFLEVMSHSTRPWFMAPGNHDFFYYGVYAAENEELLKDAAWHSGVSLQKGRFIRLYVATILRQEDPGCAALAAALGIEPGTGESIEETAKKLPASFEWELDDGIQGLLRRICWHIDEEASWRSFILQCIDLSRPENLPRRSHVYLLDSCQYQRRPEMVPNAWGCFPISLNCGLTGQMLPDQLRKIREWLDDRGPDTGTTFMCHHPFEEVEPRTRTNLGYLWREYRIGMMVTAHTHSGYFAHHDLGGRRDEVELNIGSTTDWPMEWRTLQSFYNVDQERIYLRADRNTLVDRLQKAGGFFEREWEIPLDAPDDYRIYKQGRAATGLLLSYYLGYHFTPYWLPEPHIGPTEAARETEESIKDTLLWTYDRLLMEFPTDPNDSPPWPAGCAGDADVREKIRATAEKRGAFEEKVELLIELDPFEQGRRSRDPGTGAETDDVRRRWKISQAAWASRFMKAKGRRLRIEDELISVDWERTISTDPSSGD